MEEIEKKTGISTFEDLEIWKEGMRVSVKVYEVLKNCKDFGLKDQMQRAAVSIPSNIAEGFERQTNKEFIQFLYIAKGSCGELRTQIYLAKELKVITNEDFAILLPKLKQLSAMISNLIKTRKTNFNTPPQKPLLLSPFLFSPFLLFSFLLSPFLLSPFLLFSFLLSPFLLFSQSSSHHLITSSSHQPSPIVILHTNDTHSHLESYNEPGLGNVGGVVRRNTFIQETRSLYPNTIVADAGDFSQGTPYFNLFKGFPEIELMNKMGYDVVALGNHEFDNGSKALAKRLKIADFKIVCANYKFKNKQLAKLVKPYTVIRMDGKKIGFFGLLQDMRRLILPTHYQEVTFLDPITVAQKIVDILKNKENCDLIICLSHLGFAAEYEGDISDKDIAESVPGIDVIIGGHSHLLLEEPMVVNDTRILQVRKNGIFVGKLVISD